MKLRTALDKINDIRNSIIGLQRINWSEHIYPLVAALDAAGLVGMGYDKARPKFVALVDRANAAEADVTRLREAIEPLRQDPDDMVRLREQASEDPDGDTEVVMSPTEFLAIQEALAATDPERTK
jgi:hypothetical protein